MTMAGRNCLMRTTRIAAILTLGLALIGCESIRQATGAAKAPPDEFTVLTKAPLIIPPDYNLRPPQPGVASRNEIDPDDQARAALFPQNAAAAAAALGANYSDGEKLLLTKTNALSVDPNIRRSVTSDVGQENQGPAFAQKVLFQGANAPAATAPAAVAPPANPMPAAAPAAVPAAGRMPNGVLYEGTGAPPPPPSNAAPRTP
jgi:Protein of unknown function (DUF3035)